MIDGNDLKGWKCKIDSKGNAKCTPPPKTLTVRSNSYTSTKKSLSFGGDRLWVLVFSFGVMVLIAWLSALITNWFNAPLVGAIDIDLIKWYHILSPLYASQMYYMLNQLWWTVVLIMASIVSFFATIGYSS